MDPILGQIQLFPFGYAPQGWALCNGAVLQIMQNQALFSLIGVNYGGNGQSTFMLPNLSNAIPYANPNPNSPVMAYYIATTGLYPMRP